MARGDHLRVGRTGYWHHGVDAGEGFVIHYTGEVGRKHDAAVKKTTLREFEAGGRAEVVRYAVADPVETVMARASSRLREADYDLVLNNCEHFAFWCKTGRKESEQVRDVASTGGGAVGVGAAAAGGIGAVSVAGVAGLGGSGIMSGLATIGGVVGGGAVSGLGVLAAAPGVLASVAMRSVLKDDASLPQTERDARQAGRIGTYAGAGVGTAGGIAAVSAAGTVAGLSGAGITSGLAAIGSVVGGGMAAGTLVVVAAPAAIAAGLGYAIYRFFK